MDSDAKRAHAEIKRILVCRVFLFLFSISFLMGRFSCISNGLHVVVDTLMHFQPKMTKIWAIALKHSQNRCKKKKGKKIIDQNAT